MVLFLICFLALCSLRVTSLPTEDNYNDWENHHVLRIYPKNEQHVQSVKTLLGEEEKCEALKFPRIDNLPIDIMCHQFAIQSVNNHLQSVNMTVEKVVTNIGAALREAEKPARRHKREAKSMNWDEFQRYETIIAWMKKLVDENPSFMSLINMGSSVEGREILAVKIGKSPLGDKTRAVWLEGGLHAREWISPATATFIIDKLVDNFKQGQQNDCAAEKIQAVNWYVAPLINPDGYEYTHTDKRLWRKNRRSPPAGSSCYGVDLNRNLDVVGYGVGASSNPCSEVYKGTEKDSEPETKAFTSTILSLKDNIRIYLTFHSYGSYWLTTWGYKKDVPVDYDKQLNLARAGVRAIQCVNPDREYTVGSAGKIFYIAGGATDDWAKATAKIPYSFTVELPENSFVIDKSKIQKIGEEMWNAMSVMAEEAARLPLGPDPAQ